MRWLIAAAILVLAALGMWQLQRRVEKQALITRVEQRLAAPPVPPPGPKLWAAIGPEDAFTRIVATGRFRDGADTRVQAVTRLGGGNWVMTPLDGDGWTLLVNRGFVPAAHRAPLPPPTGTVVVRGLLRTSEPGGGFLRTNDAAADRWYSRDVRAIAARRGLVHAAPYFLDADASGSSLPRGGLTVARFADNHLLYALTWFACAILLAVISWTRGRKPD